MNLDTQELFNRADVLLFKDNRYSQAEQIYRQILNQQHQAGPDLRNSRNQIDALNSIAYCIKFKHSGSLSQYPLDEVTVEQLNHKGSLEGIAKKTQNPITQLILIYSAAIKLDAYDIEANFNIAGIYMLKGDENNALKHFKKSIKKDEDVESNEIKTMYNMQFIKAYFNIGLILDKQADFRTALAYYCRAYDITSDKQSQLFLKVATNLAVCYEKNNQRDQSMKIFDQIQSITGDKQTSRLRNNVGVMHKRNGNVQKAQEQYCQAIESGKEQFFPQYNLAVSFAQEGNYQNAMDHFQKALQALQHESLHKDDFKYYLLNIYTNMAIVNEKLMKFQESMEFLVKAEQIDGTSQKVKALKNRMQQILKGLENGTITQEDYGDSGMRRKTQTIPSPQRSDTLKVNTSKGELNNNNNQDYVQSSHTVTDSVQKLSHSPARSRADSTLSKSKLTSRVLKNNSIILNNQPMADGLSDLQSRKSSKLLSQRNQQLQNQKRSSAIGSILDESRDKVDDIDIDDVNKVKFDDQYQAIIPLQLTQDEQKQSTLAEQGDITDLKKDIIDNAYKSQINQSSQKAFEDGVVQQSFHSENSKKDNDEYNKWKNEQINRNASSLQEQVIEDGWKNYSAEECQKIIESKANDERHCKAYFRMAQLLLEDQKYSESMQMFEKSKQIFSSTEEEIGPADKQYLQSRTFYYLAECLYRQTDVSDTKINQAIEYIEKAEQLNVQDQFFLFQIYLLKGKFYDLSKKYDSAQQSFETALTNYEKQKSKEDEVDSQLGNVQFRYGWALIRSKKDIDKGIQQLLQADMNLQNNFDLKIKLAQILIQERQDYQNAKIHALSALKLKPDDPEVLFMLGKIHLKDNQTNEAIQKLLKAIEQSEVQNNINIQKQKAGMFFNLGQAYELQKDYKLALQYFKKCLAVEQNHFGACIHLANLLANLSEGQRALKYFEYALRIDGNSVNAKFGIGKVYQQLQQSQDAINQFKKVIEQHPQHFKSYTQLGIIYLEQEDYKASADCLKRALAINKEYPLALLTMGNLLFETNHPENAIKYHLHALKYNENEIQALIGVANAYYDISQPGDAIKYYKKAIEQDNNLSEVHYNLANSYFLIKETDLAIKEYLVTIQQNPKKSECFYNLANAYSIKEEHDLAIENFNKSLELDCSNVAAIYNLANSLYLKGELNQSVVMYLKALEIEPNSSECHFNLGTTYNDLKDYKNSIIHYQRCIEIDSDNKDAEVCLSRVIENQKMEEQQSQKQEQESVEVSSREQVMMK